MGRRLLEHRFFVSVDVGTVALGEAIDEERAFARAVQDDGAKAARLALPRPCQALLDDAAVQVGVDAPAFGAVDGIQHRPVRNPLLAGESLEPTVLEDFHAAIPGPRPCHT